MKPFFQFLRIIFTMQKKTIIFLNRFPSVEDLKDGYYQRVDEIDHQLSNNMRIYFDINNTNYQITFLMPHKRQAFFQLIFSRKFIDRIKASILFHLILLRFGRIYIHSIGSVAPAFCFRLFCLARKRVLDLHGAAPEEVLMTTANLEDYDKFNLIEELTIQKSHIIIAVTEAMKKHIQKKYGLPQSKKILVIPICPPEFSRKTTPITLKNPHKIIYCGGLQIWQQVEKMLNYVHQNPQYDFIFLVPRPDKLKTLYFELFNTTFPGITCSAAAHEVKKWYETVSYGLLFREDHIVNKVASPTKLFEYINNGILPIVDAPNIGDFLENGYQYLDLCSSHFPEQLSWEKMITHNLTLLPPMSQKFKDGTTKLRELL